MGLTKKLYGQMMMLHRRYMDDWGESPEGRELWNTAFKTLADIMESTKSLSEAAVTLDEEAIELELLSRVRPRGGAGVHVHH